MDTFTLNHLLHWIERNFEDQYHEDIFRGVFLYLAKMSEAEMAAELGNDWQTIYRHCFN